MLNLYSRIAKILVPANSIIWLAIAMMAVIIVAIFISANVAYEHWLVPCALMVLWLLLLLMLTQLFPNIPDFSVLNSDKNSDGKNAHAKEKRTLGRWQRFKLKIKKFAYRSLAFIFTVLTVGLLFLTYRSLNVALSG